MSILLIAEKPSVAKTYCEMLEQLENETFTKKDGYFKGNKYNVSWCYGHLVETEEPKAYGWENWEMETLPMIPEKWKYRVKQDPGIKKQYKLLKELIDNSKLIINGTDAAREGELIYRLVILQAEALNKPQQRLWTNSFVLKDLKKAWNNKKDIKEYNNLFSAAMLRAKSDWLVGLNCTRAYSLATNVKGLSVGRVQTPTLNLIVERDIQIENWKDKYYFELKATWKNINFLYKDDNNESKFENINSLENIKNEIENNQGEITQVEKTKKSNYPSRPFSLSTLQQVANNNLDFTAQKTLDLCQKLYESKLVTYPRTDSEYLPKNMLPEAYDILESLSQYGHDKKYLNEKGTQTSFFNDKKVSDHFAIIPTGETPRSLSQDELALYNLIVKRFITAFGKPFIYDETKAILKVKSYNFYTTFRAVIDNGYKSLFIDNKNTLEDKNTAELAQEIKIEIIKGDTDRISKSTINKVKVTKPKYFTEATLLKAMELCGKSLDDKELTEAMKENGLGTPATRAGTIETLKKRHYIKTKGKNLISTKKGQELINIVDSKLKSPQLTGEWEKELKDIEKGKANWRDNIKATEIYVEQIISKIKINHQKGLYKSFSQQAEITSALLYCPKCKQQSIKQHAKGNFCQTKEPVECGFVLWPKVFNKKLSQRETLELLTKGKTSKKVKGMIWKEHKFDGILMLTKEYKVEVEKSKEIKRDFKINCPKCKQEMKINNGGIFCDCGQKIFRKNFGNILDDKTLLELITLKKTKTLSFKGKKGKYNANLLLVEDPKTKYYITKLNFNN